MASHMALVTSTTTPPQETFVLSCAGGDIIPLFKFYNQLSLIEAMYVLSTVMSTFPMFIPTFSLQLVR